VRRLATLLIALSIVTLTGCKKDDGDMAARSEEPYVPLSQMDEGTGYPPPLYTPNTGTDSTTFTATPPAPAGDAALSPADSSYGSGSGNVHVVRKGDTLFSLARAYYNNESKWRDIWDANRSQIPNPDQISVGMQLVMP
jgi:nucleoid-associated protein YgaU